MTSYHFRQDLGTYKKPNTGRGRGSILITTPPFSPTTQPPPPEDLPWYNPQPQKEQAQNVPEGFGHFGQQFGSYYPRPDYSPNLTASKSPSRNIPSASLLLPPTSKPSPIEEMVQNVKSWETSNGDASNYYDNMLLQADLLRKNLQSNLPSKNAILGNTSNTSNTITFTPNTITSAPSTASTSFIQTTSPSIHHNNLNSQPNFEKAQADYEKLIQTTSRTPPFPPTTQPPPPEDLTPQTKDNKALECFDFSSITWTKAVVVQVNNETCDVISDTSSHVATIPFDRIRHPQSTYTSQESVQIYMPMDQTHRWRNGTVAAATTSSAAYAYVEYNDHDIGSTTNIVVPLNLLRSADLNIGIGKQIQVMNYTKSEDLQWINGYTQEVSEEFGGSSMILIKPQSGAAVKKSSSYLLSCFQTDSVVGRHHDMYSLPIYFVRETSTQKQSRKRFKALVLQKKQDVNDESNESIESNGMNQMNRTNQTNQTNQVMHSNRGHHNNDDISSPSLIDYSGAIDRLKIAGLEKTYKDTNNKTRERQQIQQQIQQHAQDSLYRSEGWISPNERKIRKSELDIREALSRKVEELRKGVVQRAEKSKSPEIINHVSNANITNNINSTTNGGLKPSDILRNLFDQVDKDADGYINVREMLIALRTNSELSQLLQLPNRIRQTDGSREAFENVFQEMDSDGDGDRVISYIEFVGYFTKKSDLSCKISDILHAQPPPPQASAPTQSPPSNARTVNTAVNAEKHPHQTAYRPEMSRNNTSRQYTAVSHREQEKKHWQPTSGWNQSVTITRKRRPTLKHTIFDEVHYLEHPYQPHAGSEVLAKKQGLRQGQGQAHKDERTRLEIIAREVERRNQKIQGIEIQNKIARSRRRSGFMEGRRRNFRESSSPDKQHRGSIRHVRKTPRQQQQQPPINNYKSTTGKFQISTSK